MAFSMNGYWKKAFLDCDYDYIPTTTVWSFGSVYYCIMLVCLVTAISIYGINGEE